MKHVSFTTRYGSFVIATSLCLALLMAWFFSLRAWQAWLLAINLVTLGLYAYDKVSAGARRWRVPEKVLLSSGFLGGTPAAILSMQLFHHKTAKPPFMKRFWLLTALQVVLLVGWVLVIKPSL